jgi:hypothetical protein
MGWTCSLSGDARTSVPRVQCKTPPLCKGKSVPVLFLTEHHAMKAYWGSRGIAPPILDVSTRWGWMVSFTPRPLYHQGKSPWCPVDRKLCGPKSRSGRGGEEKNSQPSPGFEPPNIQPVAQRYTTELSTPPSCAAKNCVSHYVLLLCNPPSGAVPVQCTFTQLIPFNSSSCHMLIVTELCGAYTTGY